jgi:cell division protein FtsI/penicillin-binding protein 2
VLRRRAIAVLIGGIERLFEGSQGAAVLLDVRTRRVLSVHNRDAAERELAPPGSVIKPIVVDALLRLRKLRADETFPCPGQLTIVGRLLTCSHPPLDRPLDARAALAYSCNNFVAHFAQRFEPGELAGQLERAGLGISGKVERADREAQQLQALGEDRVLVTASGMAAAYRLLAVNGAVADGLEDAVEFGTAQRARLAGLKVAGKTGSAQGIAWFAGFAPSRSPEVAVAVMLHARSGGSDAAPVGGQILQAWRAGRL